MVNAKIHDDVLVSKVQNISLEKEEDAVYIVLLIERFLKAKGFETYSKAIIDFNISTNKEVLESNTLDILGEIESRNTNKLAGDFLVGDDVVALVPYNALTNRRDKKVVNVSKGDKLIVLEIVTPESETIRCKHLLSGEIIWGRAAFVGFKSEHRYDDSANLRWVYTDEEEESPKDFKAGDTLIANTTIKSKSADKSKGLLTVRIGDKVTLLKDVNSRTGIVKCKHILSNKILWLPAKFLSK